MPDLLFLAQRIPYPPNKGDKIRSWNMLDFLASRFTVHLGSFIDDPADWEHTAVLERICASCCFVPLKSSLAKAKSFSALLKGTALTFDYFGSRRLSAWVDQLHHDRSIAVQFVSCSSMVPYADPQPAFDGLRIIDFIDVDSAKWQHYADTRSGPIRWLYQREARLLMAAEHAMAARADFSLFVSEAEAALFRSRSGLPDDRVLGIGNGVDLGFFDPDIACPNPYPPGGPVLVFTGMMDYWPNIDAVEWFCRDILPAIGQRVPDARVWIVGARPTAAVQQLARSGQVAVTGRVPDVRPYLRHATLAIAPLRVARGIQNKVLEAMAMAKPVVATPAAFEGIEACSGDELVVADGSESFADAVATLLGNEQRRLLLGTAARRRMVGAYAWSSRLAPLAASLERWAQSRTGDQRPLIDRTPTSGRGPVAEAAPDLK